jgi:hypothetical protein
VSASAIAWTAANITAHYFMRRRSTRLTRSRFRGRPIIGKNGISARAAVLRFSQSQPMRSNFTSAVSTTPTSSTPPTNASPSAAKAFCRHSQKPRNFCGTGRSRDDGNAQRPATQIATGIGARYRHFAMITTRLWNDIRSGSMRLPIPKPFTALTLFICCEAKSINSALSP